MAALRENGRTGDCWPGAPTVMRRCRTNTHSSWRWRVALLPSSTYQTEWTIATILETTMRIIAVFLLALIAATVFVVPTHAITLVEKGKARAVIVLPEKPSPVAEGAARVLRDHIKQMSGAELPIRTEDRMPGSPTQDQAWVLIGVGKLTDKLG